MSFHTLASCVEPTVSADTLYTYASFMHVLQVQHRKLKHELFSNMP